MRTSLKGLCFFLFCLFFKPLFNQEDPIEIKNLFFKGDLAKIGSSKYKIQLQNYTDKTQTNKQTKVLSLQADYEKQVHVVESASSTLFGFKGVQINEPC